MKTKIVYLDALLLGGVSFYGDPISSKGSWDAENEIGKTCQRLADYMAENPNRPFSLYKPLFYEVHIYGPETMTKGYFEVFAGEEVSTAELPVSLSAKYIPASEYMRVTLYGQEIVSDWWQALDAIISAEANMTRNFGYILQVYDERFKGMDNIKESVLDAYIPIQRG